MVDGILPPWKAPCARGQSNRSTARENCPSREAVTSRRKENHHDYDVDLWALIICLFIMNPESLTTIGSVRREDAVPKLQQPPAQR